MDIARSKILHIQEAIKPQTLQTASLFFAEYYTSVGFEQKPCVSRLLQDIDITDGKIFLAYLDTEVVGVVSYVYTEPSIAELRGLYVRPFCRKKGSGSALIEAVLANVKQDGGNLIRLYTLPTLMQAISLYRKNGFYDIPPYKEGLLKNTIFMEKTL